MKRTLAWLTLLIMLFALPVNQAGAAGNTLHIGHLTRVSGEFFTEMWGNNTSDIDVRMLIHGYDIVMWMEDESIQPDNTVVKSLVWSRDPGGDPVATIEIYPNLKFSDGDAITARDYVFSLLIQASPLIAELGGRVAYKDQIRGITEYAKGEAEQLAGVRLLSKYRYSVRFSAESLPYFYQNALLETLPYPTHVIAPGCKIKDDGAGAYITGMTAELLQRTLNDPETGYRSHPTVSSGPYKLVSYDQKTGVVEFQRNRYYKGNCEGQKPSIPRIILKETRNQTLLNELQDGTLDLVNKISSAEVIKAVTAAGVNGKIASASYPRRGMGLLAFAVEQPLTSSLLLRQAVAHMVDRQGLVDTFLEGYGEPVYGFYGAAQWMAKHQKETLKGLNLYACDQNLALNLLVQDGWTLDATGAGYDAAAGGLRHKMLDGQLVPLQLRAAITPLNKAADHVIQTLQKNLQALGGELIVSTLEMDELLLNYYRHKKRTYDLLFLGTNFPLVFDPFYNFHTDDMYQTVYNTTGIRDERLMALADQLRRTEPENRAVYLERWFALQQRFMEVLPMVPLYSNTYYDAFGTQLENYHPDQYESWAVAVLYATLK